MAFVIPVVEHWLEKDVKRENEKKDGGNESEREENE